MGILVHKLHLISLFNKSTEFQFPSPVPLATAKSLSPSESLSPPNPELTPGALPSTNTLRLPGLSPESAVGLVQLGQVFAALTPAEVWALSQARSLVVPAMWESCQLLRHCQQVCRPSLSGSTTTAPPSSGALPSTLGDLFLYGFSWHSISVFKLHPTLFLFPANPKFSGGFRLWRNNRMVCKQFHFLSCP